jgi:hypothetical protein
MNGDTSWRTIERRPDKLIIRKQPNGLVAGRSALECGRV